MGIALASGDLMESDWAGGRMWMMITQKLVRSVPLDWWKSSVMLGIIDLDYLIESAAFVQFIPFRMEKMTGKMKFPHQAELLRVFHSAFIQFVNRINPFVCIRCAVTIVWSEQFNYMFNKIRRHWVALVTELTSIGVLSVCIGKAIRPYGQCNYMHFVLKLNE